MQHRETGWQFVKSRDLAKCLVQQQQQQHQPVIGVTCLLLQTAGRQAVISLQVQRPLSLNAVTFPADAGVAGFPKSEGISTVAGAVAGAGRGAD